GLEQGLKEGAQRQLLRVLDHRFGPVPPEVSVRIQELDVTQLETLVDVALEVDSLGEFLGHLPHESNDGQGPTSGVSTDIS
ncbi:MAG: DUF4351 domain-containing protein, partial [Anaerolineae bacterium]